MTIQSRSFGISLAIHAGVFILVLAAGMITPRSKAVVPDFSLGNSLNASQERAAASVRQLTSAARERQTITPTVKDEQSVPIVKDKTEETVKPFSEQPKTSNVEAADSDSSASSSIGSAEAKAGYLAVHFIYIRDKIFRNLGYPSLARKMGWEGKVTVALPYVLMEASRISPSSGAPASRPWTGVPLTPSGDPVRFPGRPSRRLSSCPWCTGSSKGRRSKTRSPFISYTNIPQKYPHRGIYTRIAKLIRSPHKKNKEATNDP